MLRIGLGVEGKSEWMVLEAAIRAIVPDVDFVRIRPDFTLVSGSPFGWRGVKAWCEENGSRLETFLSGVPSLPLHLLVVHADCSMAHNEDARRPCPPAVATADALRGVIVSSWLSLPSQPPYVVVVNPAMTTDAWIVGALQPPYSGLAELECDDRAEFELVRLGFLRQRDGEVKKAESSYKPLVEMFRNELALVRRHCTQLDRFCIEIANAARLVTLPPV